MNKQQMKLANYGTTINAVVEATQDNQEKMAPLFEPLRKAIDENKLADYDLEAYQQTQTVFSEGQVTMKRCLSSCSKSRRQPDCWGPIIHLYVILPLSQRHVRR